MWRSPESWRSLRKTLQESFPDNIYNYRKSTFLDEMTDDVLDVIVEHANRMQSPHFSVLVEFYAGAASRIGHDDTAFAQRRANSTWGSWRSGQMPTRMKTHRPDARHDEGTKAALERQPPDCHERRQSGGDMSGLRQQSCAASRGEDEIRSDEFFIINQNVKPRG
jgi:hypothetical protein